MKHFFFNYLGLIKDVNELLVIQDVALGFKQQLQNAVLNSI